MLEQALDVLAVRTRKALALQRFADDLLFFLRTEIGAEQILRDLGGLALRKIDDIDRRAPFANELGNGLVKRVFRIAEIQRHRTLGRTHNGGSALVEPCELFSKKSVSPKVADISRKRVCGMLKSGICAGRAAITIGE